MMNRKNAYPELLFRRTGLAKPLLILVFVLGAADVTAQDKYFDLSILSGTKTVFTGLFHNEMTGMDDSVFLVTGQGSEALFYSVDLFTTVCTDTLCKPVFIYLMWDLAGNYQDYRVYRNNPLTKIDHDPFRVYDYRKLHYILSDKRSILKSYSKENISDLLPANIERDPLGVDAVSGATPAEIRESIVEGALFSCHTLWHYCHGRIRDLMTGHTESELMNVDFLHQLLASGDIDLVEYALPKLPASPAMPLLDDILLLVRSSSSYRANRVLLEIPEGWYRDNAFVQGLWRLYPNLHFGTREIILEGLALNQSLDPGTINGLMSVSSRSNEKHFTAIMKVIFQQNEITRVQEQTLIELAKSNHGRLSGDSFRSLESSPVPRQMEPLKNKIIQILRD